MTRAPIKNWYRESVPISSTSNVDYDLVNDHRFYAHPDEITVVYGRDDRSLWYTAGDQLQSNAIRNDYFKKSLRRTPFNARLYADLLRNSINNGQQE